jgi:hypothetical protein
MFISFAIQQFEMSADKPDPGENEQISLKVAGQVTLSYSH